MVSSAGGAVLAGSIPNPRCIHWKALCFYIPYVPRAEGSDWIGRSSRDENKMKLRKTGRLFRPFFV